MLFGPSLGFPRNVNQIFNFLCMSQDFDKLELNVDSGYCIRQTIRILMLISRLPSRIFLENL